MWSYRREVVLLMLGIMKLVSGDNCLDVDSVVQSVKYMKRQVFRNFLSQSLYTCASECLMSSACLSFGFDKKTRTCLLNSNSSDTANVVDRRDSSSVIFNTGHRKYMNVNNCCGFGKLNCLTFDRYKYETAHCSMTHNCTRFLWGWSVRQSLFGRCAERICPKNNRCEVTRRGLARCVPEFQGCDHPPEVVGSNIKYDGHYQGAVATYSCDADFRTCYSNVTSTYQSSGTWYSLADLCGQYRWHNPIKGVHSFPCGPSSKFQLIMNGAPTEDTKWTILIKKQVDTLFFSQFRLNYQGESKVVVIPSVMGGLWGAEERCDVTMAVGITMEVKITPRRSIHVIDGVSIHSVTERDPGAKPDRVWFGGVMSVRMMKWIS